MIGISESLPITIATFAMFLSPYLMKLTIILPLQEFIFLIIVLI